MNILISTIIIFVILSSGCLEKTITIDADEYSKSVIKHTLELSGKNITKYINSVTVYNDEKELNEKCKLIEATHITFNETPVDQYVGCVEIKYVSDSENADLDSVDMYILSDDKLKDYCNSEANTVAKLIGRIEYSKKFSSKITDAYLENLYAEKYADQRIKDKCESEEFVNLNDKLQTIHDNYNNSIKANENAYKLAKDEYKLSEDEYYFRWGDYILIENLPDEYLPDEYRSTDNIYVRRVNLCTYENQKHCGIPNDKYYQYSLDYNKYQNAYNKYQEVYQNYSNTYDNLYSEYSENYNKISEEMNKTLINYRYPFEIVSK